MRRRPPYTTASTALACATALAMSMACGASFQTREPTERTTESEGPLTGVSQQAGLPDRHVDVLEEWNAGDAAYRSGDAPTAQVHFGTVYVVDPGFGQGQVVAALNETCRVIQNDCTLVMGRLDALRLVYTEQLGPIESWVPEQRSDYEEILACYNDALAGQFDDAYGAGYGAVNAPLPAFAQLARVCLDRVQMIRSQIQMAQQWEQALAEWRGTYPEFAEAYAVLSGAFAQEDWDAIVDRYAAYKIAEETIAGIVGGGLLAEHPELREDVIAAEEMLADVWNWEDQHVDQYESMRDAIAALEDDPDYNQALMEYERIYAPIPAMREEIASLELAAEATSGSERRSIDRRIDAKEAEIRDIRRDLRRIMVEVNDIRERVGLPPREAPYGLE